MPGAFGTGREHPSLRKVFHWHGDTFSLPDGAILIASSSAFPHQGFFYRREVIALQFHLEVTPSGVKELVEHGRNELERGPFVQTEQEILEEKCCFAINHELMFRLLDYLSGLVSPGES